MNTRLRQYGTTITEFAIVGAVLALVAFGTIEFGRIIFSLNMLQEGARRSARVAAVCAVDNPAIKELAVTIGPAGLASDNVVVEYLDEDGRVLGNAPGNYAAIQYVRVRIVNYSMPLVLPVMGLAFDAPEFSSTLPRESLGIARYGDSPAC